MPQREFKVGDEAELVIGNSVYSARVICTDRKGAYSGEKPIIFLYAPTPKGECVGYAEKNGTVGASLLRHKPEMRYANVYNDLTGGWHKSREGAEKRRMTICNRNPDQKFLGYLEGEFIDGRIRNIRFVPTSKKDDA